MERKEGGMWETGRIREEERGYGKREGRSVGREVGTESASGSFTANKNIKIGRKRYEFT
jgi:hypothetical protein